MTYNVKVIEHSRAPGVPDLITLQCTYPRYIHAEVMTHRVFSRNASSSRAIPTAKLIKNSLDNMVMPIKWGKNQAGMQASESELTSGNRIEAERIWKEMAEFCAKGVARLNEIGLHKQWANRPLEWFGTITTLITSTNWDNWDELRDHNMAQPEIMHLAKLIKAARQTSIPNLIDGLSDMGSLYTNHWHLPYVSTEERANLDIDTLLKISTARCARVSYLTQEGTTPSIEKDIELYDRLVGSKPLHASPCEHQATPAKRDVNRVFHGNLDSWIQHRKVLELVHGNLSNI